MAWCSGSEWPICFILFFYAINSGVWTSASTVLVFIVFTGPRDSWHCYYWHLTVASQGLQAKGWKAYRSLILIRNTMRTLGSLILIWNMMSPLGLQKNVRLKSPTSGSLSASWCHKLLHWSEAVGVSGNTVHVYMYTTARTDVGKQLHRLPSPRFSRWTLTSCSDEH